jgi:hypothetical protein
VTDYGSADEEIRVDVAAKIPPRITLGVPKGGYIIPEGQPLELTPAVDNNDAATYVWTVGSEAVSTAQSYTFSSATAGTFRLALKAANEDGKDSIKFDVHVKTLAEMPFSWTFDRTTFQVPQGRTIALCPLSIANDFAATYTWTVDDAEVQQGPEPLYVFNSEERELGNYSVKVTMENPYHEASQNLTVTVCEPEGTYRRPVIAMSVADWNKVYEFLPAPGQFVNANYTVYSMAEAITYAEDQLKQTAYVSLGGFGGYIVLGFDHSIDNDGGYNFQVLGNSFDGSSEPGIVWVMQDENGDGLPNDTWYELKGSEYGKTGETIQDYEVTYYRPSAPKMPVSWTDNQGKAGSIDYITGHNQDYYYPLWVKTNTYTLRGVCLKSRTTQGTIWRNESFDWGYADNFSTGADNDRLTNDINYDANVNANHFKISNAVGLDGQPANLAYIDFIKVQTGVNVKAGILGENSTEVFGARDYNLIK